MAETSAQTWTRLARLAGYGDMSDPQARANLISDEELKHAYELAVACAINDSPIHPKRAAYVKLLQARLEGRS